MTRLAAYQVASDAEDGPVRWQRLADPRELVTLGPDSFVIVPRRRRRRLRAYVNGIPVIGLQRVRPGDFVRTAGPKGATSSYRLGPAPAASEPGRNRRCQFTGMPITGEAVRCPGCRRLLKSDVADEYQNRCPVCATPIDPDPTPDWPEELA